MVQTCVALVRGINVGGKNLIGMRDLVECVGDLGHGDAVSYSNTGNVVFTTRGDASRALERSLETALERRFGVETRVLVRTLAQMRALVEAIDALWNIELDEKRNVIFLAREIDDERVLEGLGPKPEIETVRYVPGALLWSARRSALTRTSMVKLSRLEIYRQMTVRSPSATRRIRGLMETVAARAPG